MRYLSFYRNIAVCVGQHIIFHTHIPESITQVDSVLHAVYFTGYIYVVLVFPVELSEKLERLDIGPDHEFFSSR